MINPFFIFAGILIIASSFITYRKTQNFKKTTLVALITLIVIFVLAFIVDLFIE